MNTLRILDSHTGGEPTRLVVEGLPDEVFLARHGPMAKRMAVLRDQHDWVRTALCNEPRGSEVMVGAALVEPSDPTCEAGVIFFNNVGYLGMCGHGTMGLAVTLDHIGRIRPGRFRVDTPVGVVAFELHAGGTQVSITNVPSFRSAKQVPIDVPGFGPMHGDVAWGGNWFFLVSDHGQVVDGRNIPELMRCATAVQAALDAAGLRGLRHLNGGVIDHVELFGPPSSHDVADSRSFVLCPGGQYDRSPCGTGTSAKVACLAADGKLAAGALWRQQSVIGSVFEASWQPDSVSGEIIPTLTGSAWVNAEVRAFFDPTDPFSAGIR